MKYNIIPIYAPKQHPLSDFPQKKKRRILTLFILFVLLYLTVFLPYVSSGLSDFDQVQINVPWFLVNNLLLFTDALIQAKQQHEREERRKELKRQRGEDTWILPEVDQRLQQIEEVSIVFESPPG